MTPRDRRLLTDILQNAHIAHMQGGVSEQLFDDTPSLKYTALYSLLIFGEAASKLSTETKAAIPSVPWDEIVGTRNFVAHGYDRVDPATILGIIEDDLPPLMETIRTFLKERE
jgi:uncharacterized protein with HEPN domain